MFPRRVKVSSTAVMALEFLSPVPLWVDQSAALNECCCGVRVFVLDRANRRKVVRAEREKDYFECLLHTDQEKYVFFCSVRSCLDLHMTSIPLA